MLRSGRLELAELPIPTVREGELLVKMRSCGICGTDIEKLSGEAITPPVLGHEVAGEVVEVGKDVKELSVGDRVFVHHHVACGSCHYCLEGSETMCPLFLRTNIEPCGFSEFFKVPRDNVRRGAVLKLPLEVGFEEATLIEPLACCLRSLFKSGLKAGQSVAVIGCGPVGILMAKAAKALGASTVIGIEVFQPRITLAKKVGACEVIDGSSSDAEEEVKRATGGIGADIVVVATGSPLAFQQAFKLVRRGGTVSFFGAPPKEAKIALELGKVFYDEVRIVPSYSTTENETTRALALIKGRSVKVSDLITHRYSLEKAIDAFETAMKGDALKVVVTSGRS